MDQKTVAKETATDSARSDRSAKILIAEDSPVQAELLRRALEGAGYQVIVACDGAEGLALAKAHHPAAVVSDINMPVMDGYAMCQAIRREDSLKSTPVILLTMLSDPEDVIHGLNAGADAYLTKPYNIPSLVARIALLLAYPPVPPPTAERRKVEVRLAGQTQLVDAHSPRMLSLLISTYENAVLQTRELAATQQALEDINRHLEQKVLEKTAALQESEEKFRSTAASAQDAIIIMDDRGRIAFWNSAAERTFGYSFEDALGKDLHSLLAPAHYQNDCRKGFDRFRSTGDGPVVGKTIELMAVRNGGDNFPVELSLSAVMLANKWHAIGILRDITKRKQTEQQLVLVNFALNHMRDAAFLSDERARIQYANDHACRTLGYSREELLGLGVTDIDPDFPPERWPDHWRELKARKSLIFEGNHRGKDGRVFPVEITANYFEFDGRGYNLGLARDISERKRAEAMQRAAARYARSLVEASLDPLVTISPEGKVTDVNRMTEEVTGIVRTELIGTDFADYFTEPEQARAGYRRVLAQGEVRDYPLTIRHRSGRSTDVLYNATVYCNEAGEPQGVFAAARDITERKQAERALKNANRALHTLSACNVALVRAGNETELLDSICRLIVETGGYRMAWVGFHEEDTAKTIRPVAQFGHEEGYLAASQFSWADTDLGRGPTGTAIRTGSVQINRNFLTDPALAPWREAALKCGFQSSIALPLRNAAGTLGVLTIDAAEPNAFDESEVKLLHELAGDLAFGIETLRTRVDRDRIAQEHQQHAEILRQSLEDSIKAVANTLEMRDPYTGGHQRRVGELAVAISRELGLTEDRINGIELAASIHDLGKISVPAEFLSKPGKLTDIEFTLIKNHAQAGHDILKDIQFPWPIATIVLQHHERLDGSGYPNGLKGDQIMLESRIMAVADVIEAMASHRPYRAALGIDLAIKEIERGRDTLYDATVADACLRLFAEQRFTFST